MKTLHRLKAPVSALLAVTMLFSSCSYSIYRHGYLQTNAAAGDCEVIIRKHVDLKEIQGRRVGSLLLEDSGFTVNCNEEEAREILRQEACSLGADFVHIFEEAQPGFFSSCYRCAATFYDLEDVAKESVPIENSNPFLAAESAKNNSNARLGYIVGAVFGALVGYWLVGSLME